VQAHGHTDRSVGLLLDSGCRRLVHADRLRGMDDRYLEFMDVKMMRQVLTHRLFVSHHHDLEIALGGAGSLYASVHHIVRGVVPSHGIQRDLDQISTPERVQMNVTSTIALILEVTL